MKDSQQIALQLEQTFNKIHVESMQGIPILNPVIKVQALGFQEYQGRVLGIIIAPWLMSVVILPTEDEDWSKMNLGDKRPQKFCHKTYKFMLNEFDGIGLCQTHSLYSPMRDFSSHEQALRVAQEFLDSLKVERELSEDEQVDEELLGRIMRGEETAEVNLDDFDVVAPMQAGPAPVRGQSGLKVKLQKKISRRNLLRGHLSE